MPLEKETSTDPSRTAGRATRKTLVATGVYVHDAEATATDYAARLSLRSACAVADRVARSATRAELRLGEAPLRGVPACERRVAERRAAHFRRPVRRARGLRAPQITV